MKAFTEYLIKQGLRTKTAQNYTKKLERLQQHIESQDLQIDVLSLKQLYGIKNQCKEQGLSLATIKQYFVCLKYYYHFIERKNNPAQLVKFQRRQQTLPTNLLTHHEILALYQSYPINSIKDKRDIAILGIMLFQGLKRAEVEQLELHYLDVNQAELYVPATSQTNARTLELHPVQMKHILEYVYEVRDILVREKNKETNLLFFSLGTGNGINNVLNNSVKELKQKNKYFKSLTQLRESRISLWLKEFGVRKAQYLSGMKNASSLMRYVTQDVEKLRQKLCVVHPLETH